MKYTMKRTKENHAKWREINKFEWKGLIIPGGNAIEGNTVVGSWRRDVFRVWLRQKNIRVIITFFLWTVISVTIEWNDLEFSKCIFHLIWRNWGRRRDLLLNLIWKLDVIRHKSHIWKLDVISHNNLIWTLDVIRHKT